MTGSLQIKNGKYYAVLNLYTPEGKRKPTWICTGLETKGNKRKAEAFLRKKLQEYEKKLPAVRGEKLFSEAVKDWLKEAKLHVDEVTLQGYTALAETHIIPCFESRGTRLCDVTWQLLQTYIDEKYQNGRLDGKGGLSARSLQLHKNILNQTLKTAVRDKRIPSNPCEFVSLPTAGRFESGFYTEAQIRQLLEAAKDEPIFPALKITVAYGLRRSELLGLKWDSVDFDKKRLTIKHTVAKVSKVVQKDKTKNRSSYRHFPLPSAIETLLLDLKAQEEENRRLFGAEYQENDYILKWPDGRPFAPDYISQRFSKILKKNNLPHIRFHDLRHSCASNLLNMGYALKDVQEWLGHSDIKMTANVYGHLDIARKQKIADEIATCILGETVQRTGDAGC